MKLQKTIDVLVLGYYGFGNLGDELLSKAVVDNLAAAGIAKERIVILSADPQKSEELTGVKCYNRWNLGTVAALMKQSKSFLLGGGGLFQDITSVKSCGYYWWIVRTAKMSGVKIWAVSQSVGPLKTKLGKWFTKNSLKSASYLNVRDKKSSALLAEWKIEHATAPDLVLGISSVCDAANGDSLLLNLRPGYDEIAKFAVKNAGYIAKKDKLKITGIAFAREDQVYLENLEAEGIIKFKKIILAENINDFEKAEETAKIAIGMRLHFAELCAVLQIPAAMAAYDPKVEAFCEEWKIPQLCEKLSDSFALPDKTRLTCAKQQIEKEFADGIKAVLE